MLYQPEIFSFCFNIYFYYRALIIKPWFLNFIFIRCKLKSQIMQPIFCFIIGTSPKRTDIQSFKPLQDGGSCYQTINKTCTAVNITALNWYIHGHHSYFFLIKVENTAGLSSIRSSDEYIHDIQLPSGGVVFDVLPVCK